MMHFLLVSESFVIMWCLSHLPGLAQTAHSLVVGDALEAEAIHLQQSVTCDINHILVVYSAWTLCTDWILQDYSLPRHFSLNFCNYGKWIIPGTGVKWSVCLWWEL